MRINKYIAHAGVASRRKAEELIKKGLITINGKVVTELATTVKSGDVVEVEAHRFIMRKRFIIFLISLVVLFQVFQMKKVVKQLLICCQMLPNAFILLDVWTGIQLGF